MASPTSVSIVLCTLGRHPGLPRAVDSVLQQVGVEVELLLVDNAPESRAVRELVAEVDDARLHYLAQPRRGLSGARNLGLHAASSDVVAFTDDDCVADPSWLRTLTGVLSVDPMVAAVTGRTRPTETGTSAERWFEQFGSFDRGDQRRVWSYSAESAVEAAPPTFPYCASYGSGNNMAFRRDVLDRVGDFDEALGAGSPAGGGEDLDMFIRLMLAGEVLVYDPAAIVRHEHRQDSAALDRQVRDYGRGLSAVIAKHWLLDRASRRRVNRRLVPGLRLLFAPRSSKNVGKSDDYPRSLERSELLGIASGPFAYVHGRRRLRRAPELGVPPLSRVPEVTR